jgi:hypothetical protein
MLLFTGLLVSCGGGAGEFDKTRAAKAVMDGIKSDQGNYLKTSGKAVEYKVREPAKTPAEYVALCGDAKDGLDGLGKLSEKGLVTITKDPQSGCSYVAFSDKATPFLEKKDKAVVVMLATVDRVEVTDLGAGGQTRTVKYKAYYKATPFGEVLLKPGPLEEEKEAGFTLSFDEGWRLN